MSDLSHVLIHHTNDCTQSINASAYTGIREGSFPRGKVASPRIPACAVSPRDPPVLDSRTNFGSVPRGHQEAAFSPGQSVTRRGFVCLPDAAVTGIVRRDDFRSIFPGIFTNSTKITTRSCRNCVSKRVKTLYVMDIMFWEGSFPELFPSHFYSQKPGTIASQTQNRDRH